MVENRRPRTLLRRLGPLPASLMKAWIDASVLYALPPGTCPCAYWRTPKEPPGSVRFLDLGLKFDSSFAVLVMKFAHSSAEPVRIPKAAPSRGTRPTKFEF